MSEPVHVGPVQGGCWFCGWKDDNLDLMSREFDTAVHSTCLKKAIVADKSDDPELAIFKNEFSHLLGPKLQDTTAYKRLIRKDRTDMVREFHEKMGLDIEVMLPTKRLPMLYLIARDVQRFSKQAGQFCKEDVRFLYSHLMFEESSELAIALASGDMLKIAHELADLMYICEGLAIALGLPIQEIFEVVHEANMTKQRLPENETMGRVHKRGEFYVSPVEKIKRILERLETNGL